ncbi:MAG: tetratricopeptide repeat protein, partial [Gammaproteobacteria bacterium]|nr:tetratricopeptide repeat protein [Gammaproteobacteria bacterium]
MLSLQLAGCGDLVNDEQKTMQMARDYLQAGKINAAAIELRNTLQENPQHAEARFLLANFYLDYGDHATAEKEFRQAGASGWNEAAVAYGRARSYLGMGKFRGMFESININESWTVRDRANLLALRAVAQAGLGKQEDALASLEAGRQLDAGALEVLRAGVKIQIVSGNMTVAET